MTAEAERRKKIVFDELERLTLLGMDVRIRKNQHQTDHGYLYEYYYLVGYLTVEQIKDFPCGEYGYTIMWEDKDDVVDE